MPTLLISLGTTAAIVPEAFLLPGVAFGAVHVITSETAPVQPVLDWFALRAPDVVLTVTRVDGFRDLTGEEDHHRFEEVLYRWIGGLRIPPDARHVCLAGGFKTMSAAMQKAAAVFGVAGVFHVLADPLRMDANGKPVHACSPQEIDDSIHRGLIHWVQLGPESGWPQFRDLDPAAYPLTTVREEGPVRWVQAPDHRLRDRLRETVERSHRIAGAWDRIPDLPFPELATWSRADLE